MSQLPCRVNGCNKPRRSYYATLCDKHQQRNRRHGDPIQPTIKKHELKPYIEFAERLIERDHSGKLKAGLSQLKGVLRSSSQCILHDFYVKGKAMNTYWVKASSEIVKVMKATTEDEIPVIVASMFLLLHCHPHRFVSDRGFTFELVRMVRSLTDLNVGTFYNHRTGRVARVYKDLPARVVELMGEDIIETYKSWVALVLQHYEKEKKAKEKAKQLIVEGFKEISDQPKW